MWEKQYFFLPNELSVKYMAHINVKMHMGDRALPTYKQHRIFFYKSFHQLFRPGKVLGELWCMLENIKQEDPQIKRARLCFPEVVAEFHIVIGRIDGGIG